MKDCNCNYGKPVCATIRKDVKPTCPPKAIIPAVTVATRDELKYYQSCFVFVNENNTAYYVDDKGRIVHTWSGVVTVVNYDVETNPLRLIDQIAYDTATNTIYFFDKQGKAFAPNANAIEFNDIRNRPQYAGEEMTSSTSIPDVTALGNSLQEQITAVKGTADTAIQPDDLDVNVMTNLAVDSNPSTTSVQLDGSKVNLKDKTTSTLTIPLPVASSTQAGVMNSAFYNAATEATQTLNALLDGAVAISSLSASPSQADLTTAWETETGSSELMNRASIFDVDNNKVWTYYTNDTTWHSAANTTAVSINTFTNNSEGTIKGSTNVGQIFAENDGTGSVNGWDSLSATVADHTTAIAAKQDTLVSGTNIKTINGVSIVGSGNVTVSSPASEILNQVYPVGSIFLSISHSTAASVAAALGGGTWVAWGQGRVPVGVGDNGETNYSTANSTGGTESHRHDFRISAPFWYGAQVGNTFDGFGAYSYRYNQYGRTYGNVSSSFDAMVNNAFANTNAGSTRNMYLRYSQGDTSANSSVQPYVTVYMWRRTA